MLVTEEVLILGLFAKFIAIVFVLPGSALFSALWAISSGGSLARSTVGCRASIERSEAEMTRGFGVMGFWLK